ncbi:MAG: hypothetical protein U0841_09880 [Chloroflexia bacterium]
MRATTSREMRRHDECHHRCGQRHERVEHGDEGDEAVDRRRGYARVAAVRRCVDHHNVPHRDAAGGGERDEREPSPVAQQHPPAADRESPDQRG